MKVLIGSEAMKHHFPDFKRDPKDIDYIVTEELDREEKLRNGRRIEYLYNPIFKDYKFDIISADDLLTLKASHIFWDLAWEKHLYDIQFLFSQGCKINKELFYALYEYWNEYHSKNKRSDLKMTSEDFFDNALTCEYEHDWLHTLLNQTPIYTKILVDNEEVLVSEEKFNNLSFEDKLELVREEIYVMAWERYHRLNYKVAYGKMLKKFIVSHAPLWEVLFILENYHLLWKPVINYYKILDNGTKNT